MHNKNKHTINEINLTYYIYGHNVKYLIINKYNLY